MRECRNTGSGNTGVGVGDWRWANDTMNHGDAVYVQEARAGGCGRRGRYRGAKNRAVLCGVGLACWAVVVGPSEMAVRLAAGQTPNLEGVCW